MASGIVEIDGADVVALFRRDDASRKPALVRCFRRSKKSDWEWIARPIDGVAVTATDVIILRKEFERCKRARGLFDGGAADSGTKASSPAKRPAGPGAPPKHDWDAVAGAIARRAHDHGMPISQGELVRDMMDWLRAGMISRRRTSGRCGGRRRRFGRSLEPIKALKQTGNENSRATNAKGGTIQADVLQFKQMCNVSPGVAPCDQKNEKLLPWRPQNHLQTGQEVD